VRRARCAGRVCLLVLGAYSLGQRSARGRLHTLGAHWPTARTGRGEDKGALVAGTAVLGPRSLGGAEEDCAHCGARSLGGGLVTPGFKEQSRVHLIHAPRRQHI
jgi:hypothetical protein